MPAHFERFMVRDIDVAGATIHCRIGGSGPALLLLHGCPQTHFMWHRVADELATHFTVVAADLRGYGDSTKPDGMPGHENYSFRAMAEDQVEVMSSLGFRSFAAVGHDRGARVLHRMALDQPAVISRIVLLDILPTTFMYESTNRSFASAYWEWFFFTQTAKFPESLLAGNPHAFLSHELGHLVDSGVIEQQAWDEYLRVLRGENAMHGICEDYRAAASVDLRHDADDSHRKIKSPLLVLYGEQNPVWRGFNMLEVWLRFAEDVRCAPVAAGHYLAEEAPAILLDHLSQFLKLPAPS